MSESSTSTISSQKKLLPNRTVREELCKSGHQSKLLLREASTCGLIVRTVFEDHVVTPRPRISRRGDTGSAVRDVAVGESDPADCCCNAGCIVTEVRAFNVNDGRSTRHVDAVTRT